MRRWMPLIAVLMVGLVIACGGGDGDDSDNGGPSGSSAEGPSASGGGGDSSGSVSGPAIATGGGASIPRAVLVHPCDVIDQALAASLTGTGSKRFNQSGSANRMSCGFRADADGGVELTMSVVRNNASGSSLNEWQRVNADAIEVRDVPWSSEGELRIGDQDRDLPRALLWAYVFARPEFDSDVFILVSATIFKPPPSISAAALTEGIEQIGKLLNEALLKAQP